MFRLSLDFAVAVIYMQKNNFEDDYVIPLLVSLLSGKNLSDSGKERWSALYKIVVPMEYQHILSNRLGFKEVLLNV